MSEDRGITVLHSFPVWLPQTQTWMYNQVRFLPSRIDCHVICEKTQNLDQFTLPNLHSVSQDLPWRRLWDRLLRKLNIRRHSGFLMEQIKHRRARILHSHFGNTGWVNMEAAKHAKLKHVVSFYGFDVHYLPRMNPVWHQRYRDLFEHVDRVLCEGPYMATCLVALGCPEHKVHIHHLGIALDEILFKPRVWKSPDLLRVLIAASFQEKKGIPYALAALGRLRQRVPVSITLIGDANEEYRSQAEKKRILAAIEQHRLQSSVQRLGYQPHRTLFEEAYKHHVFLSPSVTAGDGDAEGGAPITMIEMAATGMPVISTTHCDIPEVIRHEATGLLAAERDVEGTTKLLLWLTEHTERWTPLLEACRQRIEAEYNVRKQGERLADIYQELAA